MLRLLQTLFPWQGMGTSECGAPQGVDEGHVLRVVAATTAAGMLEWYDFAVFGFLARDRVHRLHRFER